MIKTVTISGADDLVKHSDLVELQSKYPFVEWGILLSKKRAGSPRYPTSGWIKKLEEYPTLKLSGHLCGAFAEDIVYNGNFDHFQPEWKVFNRFQLNFNAEESPKMDFSACLDKVTDKQIIFQIRGLNQQYLELCWKQGRNVAALFDRSGGTGVLPEDWPEVLSGISCAYAGGLGHENLEKEIPKILNAAKGESIGLDMESKVTTENKFDLNKVIKCLEITTRFVK